MTVTISVRYEGGLRCTARHGPSDTALTTDAPVDNQGRGESFSPTDLVATAFATCTMTIMGIVAERDGLPVTGIAAEVEKHMAADPRRIAALPLTLRVSGPLDEAQRSALETAARGCPVCHSLSPDIRCEIRFEYDG
ncbi:MAG: OsmC family protein [Planctomycetota bacterium]